MLKNIETLNVTTKRRRNCFVSKPNYHTKKIFTENLLPIEMKNVHVLMNKPVYLGLSILDLSKTTDTSNYEIDRPLPTGKNKKVIGLMKDELVEHILKKIVGLRAKTYSYLKDNDDEDKISKTDKNLSHEKES